LFISAGWWNHELPLKEQLDALLEQLSDLRVTLRGSMRQPADRRRMCLMKAAFSEHPRVSVLELSYPFYRDAALRLDDIPLPMAFKHPPTLRPALPDEDAMDDEVEEEPQAAQRLSAAPHDAPAGGPVAEAVADERSLTFVTSAAAAAAPGAASSATPANREQ
jgi:hypothetical protein